MVIGLCDAGVRQTALGASSEEPIVSMSTENKDEEKLLSVQRHRPTFKRRTNSSKNFEFINNSDVKTQW